MKNTKRCFARFSFYDRTGIAAFLEKQAENGWMLDKRTVLGWRFRRIEPKKIHFSVVYFAKASSFDPEPSDAQLAFFDFCEHTGWKLAVSNAQMQIFCNEASDPTPIETDAALEVSAIHASAKKSHLPFYYILAGMGILQIVLFFLQSIIDPVDILASNADLYLVMSAMCWMAVSALSAAEIVRYRTWYKRAKSAAELDGSFLETGGRRNFQIIVLCTEQLALVFDIWVTGSLGSHGGSSIGGSKMILIALASVAVILGMTAIVVYTSELMKKMKLSAKINHGITITVLVFVISLFTVGFIRFTSGTASSLPEKVPAYTYEVNGSTFEVYHDELPLTVEDLTETDYDGYSYEIETIDDSVFIEKKKARQYPRGDLRIAWPDFAPPSLRYSITTVRIPFVYELCKKALLDDFAHNYAHPVQEEDTWEEHIILDAAPWGANEAYQLKVGGELQMRFLLCYDSCIVELDLEWGWQLTPEQMKTVGEKLGK